jgi:hypothetical protein
MKIDPTINLSFSVASQPGVYALLLGSGVSRTAGIPTGWEIVLDLISKVAKALGEVTPNDPIMWYRAKYSKEPEYSDLLEAIASTGTERNAILRSYFEPNDDERKNGLKLPTPAHRAIAQLVKLGYIRIIVTTNFDHLLESALVDEGMTPDVISNEDALHGTVPYVHSKCTIIKLHGDYRDTRIKNTSLELKSYSKKFNDLLDRVFDEFGLVICGWSAEWDTALLDAILRCSSHRYTTYWTTRGNVSDNAQRVIESRKAQLIAMEGADQFFTKLNEQIISIEESNQPHPLSKQLAIATLKRYLSDKSNKIKLEDLLESETTRLHDFLLSDDSIQGCFASLDVMLKALEKLEMQTEILTEIFINLCKYDRAGEYAYLLTESFKKLVQYNRREDHDSIPPLFFYAALFSAYKVGMMALSFHNYMYLSALLLYATFKNSEGKEIPVIEVLNVSSIFHDRRQLAKIMNPDGRVYTPAHNYVYQRLFESMKPVFSDEKDFELIYDVYEFLSGMVYIYKINGERADFWAPPSRSGWKWQMVSSAENAVTIYITEIADSLLAQRFFDGKRGVLNDLLAKYWNRLEKLNWH